MAKTKTTTKSTRRPQPAKPAIRWADYDHFMKLPRSSLKQRRLARRAIMEMDDEAVRDAFGAVIRYATLSQTRADLAELARIKATCAIIPAKKVPMRELLPVKGNVKARSGRRVRP